jgi:hypothetical protein
MEGHGEAFYRIGIKDDGHSIGISKLQMMVSICIDLMCRLPALDVPKFECQNDDPRISPWEKRSPYVYSSASELDFGAQTQYSSDTFGR